MNNFIYFNDFKKQITQKQDKIKTYPLNLSNKQNQNRDTFSLTVPKPTLSAELENAKRQNGLIEKLTDKIKNAVGIGISSKKIQKSIEEGKNNQQIEQDIKNYRRSQENTAQAVADVASMTASTAALFSLKHFIQKKVAQKVEINNIKISDLLSHTDNKTVKKLSRFIEKNINKKYFVVALCAIPAMFVGGFVKNNILKLNRIATEQYKAQINPQMSKDEIKEAKKSAKKQKKNANLRNSISGMVNGLISSFAALFGVAGIPLGIILNSLNRYFIASKEDSREKSLNSYFENLDNSKIINILSAVAIAIPAIKNAKFDKVFNKNLQKTIEKLKNADLKATANDSSSYKKLENILFEDEKIANIIKDYSTNTPEKIQALSDENIFALKFKQIGYNNDDLSRALKTECPVTRTIEEAQSIIEKTFGKKYTVLECKGVGTIAETYLVKDEKGKEYCIKMLKNGINEQKILKDKEKFIDIVKNSQKTNEEKEFLIKNIESIADGILAEIDLKNEQNAAIELAKVTKNAKVVVPLEVKDNIYVMEKANGICLQDLTSYLGQDFKWREESLQDDLEYWQKKLDGIYTQNKEYYKEKIAETQEKLNEIKEKQRLANELTKDLSKENIKNMLEKYQDILIEQFSKIDKNGKIIHGDIHPGNIFIDLDALKRGEKNFFTLIDTGNVVNQDANNAFRFLNFSKYVQNADIENIAKFTLNGAKLPQGMSEKEAYEKLSKELERIFFDDKTKLESISNDSIKNICENIMEKLNIIPSDAQGNLAKAKTSAEQSLHELEHSLNTMLQNQVKSNLKNKGIDLDDLDFENMKSNKSKTAAIAKEYTKASAELATSYGKYYLKKSIQERKNLSQMSAKTRVALKKGQNAPNKNSEEYLTYIFKPHKREKIIEDI